MAAAKAGLFYVCNPNNPTASLTPKQEVDAMVAAMPAGSVALIDEAYCHFVDDPAFETAIKHVVAGKDVVVARTFSKIYGLAGYRVGYAVARRELAAALRRQILDNNLNMMGLEAALASLDVADLVPRTREKNQKSRQILLDWCGRHKMKYAPSHANFVFFHIGRPAPPVIQALRERGVAVGRPFPPLLDWMRVSVGTEEEMRSFIREYEAAEE
jgi:histidinol-phosphate aminotransferase